VNRVFALVLLAFFTVLASGKDAAPAADDPALEKRVMALAEELRCLVCQNQTLADSNAELALDLRRQIREQLKAGASERQVIDYLVDRYGDFVLYRPPLKATTVLLWFGPFLLLALGAFVLVRRVRRQRDETPAPLSQAEHARAAELLGPGDR
jgi:cytochrome c-type biogenesis protein CcmH